MSSPTRSGNSNSHKLASSGSRVLPFHSRGSASFIPSRSHPAQEPRMRGSTKMRTKSVPTTLTALAVILTATASWADAVPNHVRDVKVHAATGLPGGTEIEIIGTVTPTFGVRVAEGGRKLLVDLNDADVIGAPEAITKPEGSVAGILTQGFKTGAGRTARLTVSLANQATYQLKADGSPPPPTPAPAETTAAGTIEGGIAAPARVSIEDVRFERKGDKDRVVVALSAMPTYETEPGPNGRLRLELRGTKLSDAALARELDVGAFKGSVRSVSTFADDARAAS